jgi:hypothetical protein
MPHPALAATGHCIIGIGTAERRRLAWHLPDDFDRRPAAERETNLEWVRTVIITGSTDYRRFQAAAMKLRYAVRFPELQCLERGGRKASLAALIIAQRKTTGRMVRHHPIRKQCPGQSKPRLTSPPRW